MLYKQYTLANGARIILAPRANIKSALFLVLVGTGSQNEDQRINGISHFLEHLFFKGSGRYPRAQDISTALDSFGAEYNAFTAKEYTGFYVHCAAMHLAKGMDVIADMLRSPLFAADELEREKGVIAEEINMYQDTPSSYAADLFELLLWGNSPLGRLTIGTKRNVASFTSADLRRYYAQQYVPRNMVVVVAGHFGEEKVRQLIEEYFAAWPKQEVTDGAPSSVATDHHNTTDQEFADVQRTGTILLHHKKTDQAHLIIGVPSYGLHDQRRFPAEVLATVLGGGMSSRLFADIREKNGMAYYVGSFQQNYTQEGYLATRIGADVSKAAQATAITTKHYEEVKEKKIGSAELKKAKDYLDGKLILGLESLSDIASWYGMQELLEHRIQEAQEFMRLINAVSADDVREIARDIFHADRLYLALIGPYTDMSDFETAMKMV